MLHCVKQLEAGVDLGGNELVGEPPKFAKGAVVSPCSDSVDVQLAKMERKVAAGAEYFQTQAVYEPEKFIEFMEKAKQFGKPVQLGIVIPKSVGMCRYMNANVAGIHIPEEMIEELKADKGKDKSRNYRSRDCCPHYPGVQALLSGRPYYGNGLGVKVPGLLELAGL